MIIIFTHIKFSRIELSPARNARKYVLRENFYVYSKTSVGLKNGSILGTVAEIRTYRTPNAHLQLSLNSYISMILNIHRLLEM